VELTELDWVVADWVEVGGAVVVELEVEEDEVARVEEDELELEEDETEVVEDAEVVEDEDALSTTTAPFM
jgi:hypothetical protein